MGKIIYSMRRRVRHLSVVGLMYMGNIFIGIQCTFEHLKISATASVLVNANTNPQHTLSHTDHVEQRRLLSERLSQ